MSWLWHVGTSNSESNSFWETLQKLLPTFIASYKCWWCIISKQQHSWVLGSNHSTFISLKRCSRNTSTSATTRLHQCTAGLFQLYTSSFSGALTEYCLLPSPSTHNRSLCARPAECCEMAGQWNSCMVRMGVGVWGRVEARKMKEERGRWSEGRGRERDGSDGRRVVMGVEGGVIFHNCMGAQRLQGSRGCPGFGTVTTAQGWLWSSVYT